MKNRVEPQVFNPKQETEDLILDAKEAHSDTGSLQLAKDGHVSYAGR